VPLDRVRLEALREFHHQTNTNRKL
jgi:hypothetical protein